jgi:hypothetical protein
LPPLTEDVELLVWRHQVRLYATKHDRLVLARVSGEFGEEIALAIEFGGVLGQFRLACPALLEQRANQDETLDVKEDAVDLLIRRSSLVRDGSAARLRRSAHSVMSVHENHPIIGH